MSHNLPPEQGKLDRIIIDELFNVVPEEWNAFMMVIEPRATDGGGLMISILNPDDAHGAVEPNAAIRDAADQLVAFLAKEGRVWESLTYKGFSTPEGAWKINITAPLPPSGPAMPQA